MDEKKWEENLELTQIGLEKMTEKIQLMLVE